MSESLMAVAFVAGLILAAFWLMFPIIIWSQLRQLTRLIAAAQKDARQAAQIANEMRNAAFVTAHHCESISMALPLHAKCEVCQQRVEFPAPLRGTAIFCPDCNEAMRLP